ncbi:MAG: hypothetical protein AAB869_00760, partial [Patescibacteria group bacterium]
LKNSKTKSVRQKRYEATSQHFHLHTMFLQYKYLEFQLKAQYLQKWQSLLLSSLCPQKKKVYCSGVVPHLDDVLITRGAIGNSGKGAAAKAYLRKRGAGREGHVFVDDLLENLSEVKMLNPDMRCIQIERVTPKKNLAAETEGLFTPDGKIANLQKLLAIL